MKVRYRARRIRRWVRIRICRHRGHVEQTTGAAVRIQEVGKAEEWVWGEGLSCTRCKAQLRWSVELTDRTLELAEPIRLFGDGAFVSGITATVGSPLD